MNTFDDYHHFVRFETCLIQFIWNNQKGKRKLYVLLMFSIKVCRKFGRVQIIIRSYKILYGFYFLMFELHYNNRNFELVWFTNVDWDIPTHTHTHTHTPKKHVFDLISIFHQKIYISAIHLKNNNIIENNNRYGWVYSTLILNYIIF